MKIQKKAKKLSEKENRKKIKTEDEKFYQFNVVPKEAKTKCKWLSLYCRNV